MMRSLLAGMVMAAAAVPAAGQQSREPVDGEALPDRLALMGQVVPRHARDIAANRWSIGTEGIDRDYSTYDAWRAYLGPLGAKHARLQSGWQRTDLGGGRYDFAWLDPIVDGMLADGVQPWLSLSYGNDRYIGGGTSRRDSILPIDAGRTAWLAYVAATAKRYRGRIREYEIWNEPDHSTTITAVDYADFALDTIRAIRAVDPDAGIIFGGLASASASPHGLQFAQDSLRRVVESQGKGRIAAITYHNYSENPDAVYTTLPAFIAAVRAIDPGIEVRQGESGAPSVNQPTYALANRWWTEETQAKWGLRRMLGDAGRGIPTSLFTMTEMHYPVAAETGLAQRSSVRARRLPLNSAKQFKGLVETRRYAPGTPLDDRSIVRTKTLYVAAQALFAIVDSSLTATRTPCRVEGAKASASAYAFRRADGSAVVAVWRDGDVPGVNSQREAVDILCPGINFTTAPRYVDLLTRAVYATAGIAVGNRLVGVPIYDSPILVADLALVNAQ